MCRFSYVIALINAEIWAIDNDIRTTRDDRLYSAEIEDTYIASELRKLRQLKGAKDILELFRTDDNGNNT